jgi:DNA-binding Lrp family transcriptional regulator
VDIVDIIDKKILLALDSNCRLSYQAMADQMGITANAIRKRFDRLVETGVIEEFVVRPEMVGSEYLVALVYTDGTEDEEEFIEYLGANLNVIQVGQIVTSSNRLYFVNCEYIGAQGLKGLGSFFRQLETITDLELHTILVPRGQMFNIKRLHLQVLNILLEDARMQVSHIANRLGITARRTGRAIREMQKGGAFWFSMRWNLSLGDNHEFYLKIEYDERISTRESIDKWLTENYPIEYWFCFCSAMEPVVFAKFVTDHFRDAQPITQAVKNEDFCHSVDVLLSYPVRKFPRLGTIKIRELIAEAGIADADS